MQERIRQLVARMLRKSMAGSSSRSFDDIRTEIADELVEKGFRRSDIEQVLNTMTPDIEGDPLPVQAGAERRTLRVFAPLEMMRLSPQARGYLLELEYNGLLDPGDREEIIERALLFPAVEVGVEHLQQVLRAVLGQDEAGTNDRPVLYH